MPVPDELDWTAAGGVPEVFTTAHDALFTQAELTVGERLLVHGAAGGVGMAAVQLGTMAGARVTATVRERALPRAGRRARRERARARRVRRRGPVRRDPRAGRRAELARQPQALAQRGRIRVIGVGGGRKVELDLRRVMVKRARIFGSMLRARSLEEKAAAARLVEKAVLPGFASGDLSVPVVGDATRWTTSATPTSASRPAASSARSSSRCERSCPGSGSSGSSATARLRSRAPRPRSGPSASSASAPARPLNVDELHRRPAARCDAREAEQQARHPVAPNTGVPIAGALPPPSP